MALACHKFVFFSDARKATSIWSVLSIDLIFSQVSRSLSHNLKRRLHTKSLKPSPTLSFSVSKKRICPFILQLPLIPIGKGQPGFVGSFCHNLHPRAHSVADIRPLHWYLFACLPLICPVYGAPLHYSTMWVGSFVRFCVWLSVHPSCLSAIYLIAVCECYSVIDFSLTCCSSLWSFYRYLSAWLSYPICLSDNLFACFSKTTLPVMAVVAVRKKVVSISHFSSCFYLQSLKFFSFVRSNQKQLTALKIREK